MLCITYIRLAIAVPCGHNSMQVSRLGVVVPIILTIILRFCREDLYEHTLISLRYFVEI